MGEQFIWEAFNAGRMVSALAFIGSIIAIWLALRTANMSEHDAKKGSPGR